MEWLAALANRFPKTRFVADEAYFEFGDGSSMAELVVKGFENVFVTRSFSKAFCLASLRCGYVLAGEAQIRELEARQNSKNVNELAQIAALSQCFLNHVKGISYDGSAFLRKGAFRTATVARTL